ncbi:hypothetical protein BO221_02590 [Archangium sp. Cb G35]|nr:hypothetical protein BO221_02590 [Archangium sp. Cb G35]
MSDPELLQSVTEALATVGGHPWVPFEVTHVELEGQRIRIWLTLHYLRAKPVCCGECGCYIPFLGMHRENVPGVLAGMLGLAEEPRVSMSVRKHHEAGYKYKERNLGTPVDTTIEYEESHFIE